MISPSPTNEEDGGRAFFEDVSKTSWPVAAKDLIFADDLLIEDQLILLDAVLHQENVLSFIRKQAALEENESATTVNGGVVELFLDKGGAKTYLELKRFYQPKDRLLFIPPEKMTVFLSESMKKNHSDMADHILTNPSFLIGTVERGPQPTHCDTAYPSVGCPEKFVIFMLSRGAPSTIWYDMEGCPKQPSEADLQDLWGEEVPPNLIRKLFENEKSRELILKWGRLLYASGDRRRGEGDVAEQFSMFGLEGCHPHCAPGCKEIRIVIFFVMQPTPFEGISYDGMTQMSKEKLGLELYQVAQEAATELDNSVVLRFSKKVFTSAIKESAQHGAWDDTLEFIDRLAGDLRTFWEITKESAKAKAEVDEEEAQCQARIAERHAEVDAEGARCQAQIDKKRASVELTDQGVDKMEDHFAASMLADDNEADNVFQQLHQRSLDHLQSLDLGGRS